MRYQLDLTLRDVEGALLRVIGVTERRGFRPLSVDGQTQSDGQRWQLRMTVEGARPDTTLHTQLSKLHDCLEVRVLPCP